MGGGPWERPFAEESAGRAVFATAEVPRPVSDALKASETVAVGVFDCVVVGVRESVGEGDWVTVGVGVRDRVAVGERERDAVRLGVFDRVGVGVRERDTVGDGLRTGDMDTDGDGWHAYEPRVRSVFRQPLT